MQLSTVVQRNRSKIKWQQETLSSPTPLPFHTSELLYAEATSLYVSFYPKGTRFSFISHLCLGGHSPLNKSVISPGLLRELNTGFLISNLKTERKD